MINIKKQIEYWQSIADEDVINAKIMIESKRYLPCLFYCHLCIEKILKALVVKETKDHPPRTHDLERLAELARIELNYEQNKFILAIQLYQLEGRYPEFYPQQPKPEITSNYFQETIILHTWLKMKL